MDTTLALELWLRSDSDHDDGAVWPSRAPRGEENGPDVPALPMSDEDVALCQRIRAGDDGAFQTLYLHHYAGLADYAAGLVSDRSAAHDIVQELFLVLWRDRSEWAPGRIGAYLYRAVRNRALNDLGATRRRARLREASPSLGMAGVGETPLSPDEDLHVARFREALDRAIDGLSEHRREIAALRWRHGKSLAEIASITGSSVKAVSMSLARTRATLQPVVDTYLRDE